MHPILEQFLDKWVWPTMPGAPGAEFRLRVTREKCLKGWEVSLQRTLGEIDEELASDDEAWKKEKALRGYAAEGVHMSIKQMSGQLLSVDIADQERYIDLQRMRARQIWDECKHSKLHADVLLDKGWVKDERELMDIAQANTQPLPTCFGLLDLASAVRNCVKLLGLPLADALRLASVAPAEFLGVDTWLGRLAPGYRADMVALDPAEIRVFATWVAGTSAATA